MNRKLEMPALNGQVVTEYHARICREQSHAKHTVEGVDTGTCPRCGDVTEKAATDVQAAASILQDTLDKYGERNPDPEGGCLARVTVAARALVEAIGDSRVTAAGRSVAYELEPQFEGYGSKCQHCLSVYCNGVCVDDNEPYRTDQL